MEDKNKERWFSLWKRIKAKGDPLPIYEDLVRRYSEPHRAYHMMSHIEQCLNELDTVRHLAENPDAVEMAIWFHDAIYDTRSPLNEEKSTGLFIGVARDAGLSLEFGQVVIRMILATHHRNTPVDSDAKLLVDIDLSILGQLKKTFDLYEQNVRKEYVWVPDEMFASERAKILQSFLQRSTIYATQFFQYKYEVKARRNLVRSIKKLSAKPS